MNAASSAPPVPVSILVAEDNKYDRMILQQAFGELGLNIHLFFVTNGEDVLHYLNRRNAYAADGAAPRPDLILMDLNMPRMDGNDAVKAIRADADLRVLPVIALSTSDNPKQITEAYENGVNAFMTKPGHFDDFVDLLRDFADYWIKCARLPKIAIWQG
jgi:CheY-like chemotaxis protein